MGQLRQAHCPVGTGKKATAREEMLAPLLLGFMLSATVVFALVGLVGAGLRWVFPPLADSGATNLFIVFVLISCAASDLLFPRVRPTLLNRQTPGTLARIYPKPIAGFLWGLDTGSVVSTFRSSAASWAALVLVLAGWGPWWTGVAYGVGFCLPLGLVVGSYSTADGDRDGDNWRHRSTESLVEMLGRAAGSVRVVAAAVAVGGVLVLQGSF
jgi:hypothetical protein